MDTLEMWNDFVRGERVTGPRTERIVCCCCEERDSDPKYDGMFGHTFNGKEEPGYYCGQCVEEGDMPVEE